MLDICISFIVILAKILKVEKQQMRIAYLILAHKNVDQLVRLINSLAHKNVSIFLHVDAKCHLIEADFERKLSPHADIYFLDQRLSGTWGGFSLVQITIHLLEACVEHGTFDYVNLISGQDFPLATYSQFCDFLKTSNESEFLNCFEAPDSQVPDTYFGLTRFEKFWLVDEIGIHESKLYVDQQITEGIKRSVPYNLKVYGGSQWFTITGRCAKYILEFLESSPLYIPFFKFTLAPDETFFSTIIMNSPFKSKAITTNNLRHINWVDGPQYPKIFSMDDRLDLLKSPYPLARKFDSQIDNHIIIELDNRLKDFG